MRNDEQALAMTTVEFDRQGFKVATRNRWQKAAHGWINRTPQMRAWLRVATDAMIDMAGVKPRARVLDVAAGTGDQTLDIAERVGPPGFVLATDLSAAILEFAKTKLRLINCLQGHVQAPDCSAPADRSDVAAIFPQRRPRLGALVLLFRPLMLLTAIISGVGSAAAETLVERGSYLVNTIMACGNCHTLKTPAGEAMAEKQLSGGLSFNTPVFTGTAANITPDPETGIGAWSDADIKRALTHGVRPSHGRLAGSPLAVMAVNFYKALLPRDLDAVVAYLRTVKPVRNEVPLSLYKAPTQHQPYPDAESGFTENALRDPVKQGAYLVTIGHCMECHAAWAKGVWDYRNGLGKGGRQFSQSLVQGFPNTWGGSIAANITSSKKSGIGGWTDAEIKRAITKGISRDGRALQPPMAYAWYDGMSEADLGAIVAWLRSLAPLE